MSAPPEPIVQLAADDNTASILIDITQQAPLGSQEPAATSNIYRREANDPVATALRIATLLPASEDYTDYTPRSGVDYSYRVEAVAAGGAVSSSNWSVNPVGLYQALYTETF